MFNNRQKLKKLLYSCLLLFGCLIPAVNGLAAESGSIKVSYHGRTDEETVVLSEAPFVLYRAASWHDGSWELSEDFQNSGVSMENTGASDRKKQAELLYAYAITEQIQGTEQKTDESGVTKFDNLTEGLYLIAQTRELKKDKRIFRSAPFLVSIPREENGVPVWDVVAEPKSEWSEIGSGGGDSGGGGGGSDDGSPGGGDSGGENPGGGIENVPGDGLVEINKTEEIEPFPFLPEINEEGKIARTPKTGDSSFLEIWLAILVISAAMMGVLGWRVMRTRNAEENDRRNS